MHKHHTTFYNLYEAKSKLSEAVKKALDGEEVILMNRGNAVAKIIPFPTKHSQRVLGFAKDIQILSGFDEIPEDFAKYT
jgi:antitoxin (DNA-binding transcriptional repressor) of toxin-antitoxin stability system